MPRPERPLDPTAGPVPAFAAELRKLRLDAGNPKYLQMARLTGRSRTALAEAAGGDHLPTWETVAAYVAACGADPLPWRVRWEEAEERLRPRSQPAGRRGGGRGPVEPVRAVLRWLDPPRRTPATGHGQARLVVFLVVLSLLSTSVAATLLLIRTNDRNVTPLHQITSQQVRIHGVDGGAVYLSSSPRERCDRPDCAISDDELMTGEFIEVSCFTNGRRMHESIADPPTAALGQDRADFQSRVWLGVYLHGKQQPGYLSVVDVDPWYREGLDLPECWLLEHLEPK